MYFLPCTHDIAQLLRNEKKIRAEHMGVLLRGQILVGISL